MFHEKDSGERLMELFFWFNGEVGGGGRMLLYIFLKRFILVQVFGDLLHPALPHRSSCWLEYEIQYRIPGKELSLPVIPRYLCMF